MGPQAAKDDVQPQTGGAPITTMARVYGLPGAPLVFIFILFSYFQPIQGTKWPQIRTQTKLDN
jgi:hypothetical protein